MTGKERPQKEMEDVERNRLGFMCFGRVWPNLDRLGERAQRLPRCQALLEDSCLLLCATKRKRRLRGLDRAILRIRDRISDKSDVARARRQAQRRQLCYEMR